MVFGLRESWAAISAWVARPAPSCATCASWAVSASRSWVLARTGTDSPAADSSRRGRAADRPAPDSSQPPHARHRGAPRSLDPAQPRPVDELAAGQVHRPAGRAVLGDGLPVLLLGPLARA